MRSIVLEVPRQLAMMVCLICGLTGIATAQDPDTEADTDDISGPVEVVPGQIRMGLHPIADGIIREGEWATIRVTLANGDESADAFISLTERETVEDGMQSYTRTVALPKGSKKDIQLLWRAGGRSVDRSVTVGVGSKAVERTFPVRLLGAEDVGIGVIGEDTLGTVAVRDAWKGPVPGIRPRPIIDDNRIVRTGLIPTADLPEKSAGLMALDWVIWPQADPTDITPQQLDALLAWVAGGGNLLVSTTDTWRAVAGSDLANALPSELLGVQDGSVDSWLTEVNQTPVVGESVPVLTTLPRLHADRNPIVLALADDGRPAWTAGVFGLGSVHLLSVDPSVGAIGSQVDLQTLWRTLLWLPPTDAQASWFRFGPSDITSWISYSGPARYPDTSSAEALSTGGLGLARGLGLACVTERCSAIVPANRDQTPDNVVGMGFGYGYGQDVSASESFQEAMRERLADIPGLAPLPLPWLGAFAIIYLMLIGPVDYIVLRVLKKQPLTWITFPLLVAVFSAVALVGTSLIKGSQAMVTRYEVVDVLPGTGMWRGHTWLGVFSTKKTELTLASGFDDAVVRPIGDGGFVQNASTQSNEGAGFYQWRAQTWSLAYVQTEWTARRNGGIVVEPDEDGVTVINRLGVDLQHAELRALGKRLDIGPMGRGESVDIVLPEPNLDALRRYIDASGELVPNGHPVAQKPLGMLGVYPETLGASLQLEGPVGFVGMSDQAYEPLTLTGLSPVERPVTVFRSHITIQPAPAEAP